MEKEKTYLDDISEIRKMMEKSTRFLSLSGLSGIVIGLEALIAAGIAYVLLDFGKIQYDERFRLLGTDSPTHLLWWLAVDAAAVLFLALLTGFLFSRRKARKMQTPVMSPAGKRMLFQMAVPLVIGGLLCFVLLLKEAGSLIAPITLIFYGLALVQASRYTYPEIMGLGFIEIVLGLLAVIFLTHGLLFWSLGFGLFHIAYGIFMYLKHER